jgi:hypothetical protein
MFCASEPVDCWFGPAMTAHGSLDPINKKSYDGYLPQGDGKTLVSLCSKVERVLGWRNVNSD